MYVRTYVCMHVCLYAILQAFHGISWFRLEPCLWDPWSWAQETASVANQISLE